MTEGPQGPPKKTRRREPHSCSAFQRGCRRGNVRRVNSAQRFLCGAECAGRKDDAQKQFALARRAGPFRRGQCRTGEDEPWLRKLKG